MKDSHKNVVVRGADKLEFPYCTNQKVEELLEGGAFGLQHSMTEAVNARALVEVVMQ